MAIAFSDPTAWQFAGAKVANKARDGYPSNPLFGAVPTSIQKMNTNCSCMVYKLKESLDRSKAYYLVSVNCRHGINGNPAFPADNWASVGYYAVFQQLVLKCKNPNSALYQSGPDSTVEQAEIGFSLGGSLSGEIGDKSNIGAGFNAGVSFSFSASEVSFTARPMEKEVSWFVRLPYVGWLSGGVPANPGNASYGGYEWEAAAIFSIQGPSNPIMIEAEFSTGFRYDWTRGTLWDQWYAVSNISGNFNWTPPVEETSAISVVEKRNVSTAETIALPSPGTTDEFTILETLRKMCAIVGGPEVDQKDGITDTFVAAIELCGIDREMGSLDACTVVVALTNKAWERFFSQSKGLQKYRVIGPGSQELFYNQIASYMVSLPSKLRKEANSEVRKLAANDEDISFYECRDGFLILYDGEDESIAEIVRHPLESLLKAHETTSDL
jgi:hypothetical protein